jgi:hypothetical protein
MQETNDEIERLEMESKLTCQQMQEISNNHLDVLIDEVFQELIGNKIHARR